MVHDMQRNSDETSSSEYFPGEDIDDFCQTEEKLVFDDEIGPDIREMMQRRDDESQRIAIRNAKRRLGKHATARLISVNRPI